MNRKRKPKQRRRINKKADRRRKGLGRHQLDVRVKRRAGEGVRRHLRIPLVGKIGAVCVAVVIAAIVGTNILGRFLWNNPAYSLTEVVYESDGWLPESAALETAGVELDMNILRLDLEEIRDQIVDLPQVRDASVVRTLPHTGPDGEKVGGQLGISVQERHPIAWLSCPEQDVYPKAKTNGYLLDQEGVAMPCQQLRPEYLRFPVVVAEGLPAIRPGQAVGSDQLVTALELITLSSEVLYDHALEIVEIKLVNRYSLVARFNNDTKVFFKPSDSVRQVEDLRAIFVTYIQQNQLLKTVDLRQDRNIPVTFAEQAVAAPGSFPGATPVERREPLSSPIEIPAGTRTVRRSIPVRREAAADAGGQIDPDVHSIIRPR